MGAVYKIQLLENSPKFDKMSGLGKIIAMNFERARMQLKITVRSNVAVVTSELKYTFRLKETFSRAKVSEHFMKIASLERNFVC